METVNEDPAMLTFPVPVDRGLVTRIQMEFMEMPGLCLSERQARRLWNIEEATCARILAILVEERFLTRSRDGAYLRSGRNPLHSVNAA
jgi:hypothetical protein